MEVKQKFRVHSYYEVLRGNDTSYFPWKAIWKVNAPLRVAFFGWMALGSILTIENLIKRGNVYCEPMCYLQIGWESLHHLLLHCPIMWELQNFNFVAFGVKW